MQERIQWEVSDNRTIAELAMMIQSSVRTVVRAERAKCAQVDK